MHIQFKLSNRELHQIRSLIPSVPDDYSSNLMVKSFIQQCIAKEMLAEDELVSTDQLLRELIDTLALIPSEFELTNKLIVLGYREDSEKFEAAKKLVRGK